MTPTVSSPRAQSSARATRPSTASRQHTSTAMPLKTPRITSPHPQTPSPNYFGLQQNNDSNAFLNGSSAQQAKQIFSPPSSTVRSTVAVSPSIIPIDQRPEFAAFRKQSDGKVFNLADLGGYKPPRPSNSRSRTNDTPQAVDRSRAVDLLDVSHSPKRMLSPGSLNHEHRRPSPATNDVVESRRMNLPLDKPISGPAVPRPAHKTIDDIDTPQLISSTQLASILQSNASFLLLDLRVSTQYTTSHISGSLNLCIPTTLLKRPTYNIQKLTDTFRDDEQRADFEQWQRCQYIIVYDHASAQLKDAVVCTNTIKKFLSEGYTGSLHILQGGFLEFSRRYPAHIEQNTSSPSSGDGRSDSKPDILPVAGGCPMPKTDNAANPFFGNIRQNMDLIGGVGQIALQHPQRATREIEEHYPAWLKRAADSNDKGAQVAKHFEQIERREKKRMEEALSGKIAWGTATDDGIRIAGLEKGSKNRYNNIYPFEHSRVKLINASQSGCDYVNASHIKTSWSNKRYISTQAPIPATFTDFWNVIWEQDIRVIVMLTAESEGGQVKAHNYWDKRHYGPIHLEFLSEKRASIDMEKIRRRQNRPHRQDSTPILAEIKDENPKDEPYVVVRRFALSHENFPFERMREITHMQYSGWPDLGTPAHPSHLLGLVMQCDAVIRSISKTQSFEPAPESTRPTLVHCSAGCGRSGAYCTISVVIDMLKRQMSSKRTRHSSPMDLDRTPDRRSSNADFFTSQGTMHKEGGSGVDGEWVYRDDLDLIQKTVEDFRSQRISMVQTLRQYVLCYESIMEWLVDQELEPVSA